MEVAKDSFENGFRSLKCSIVGATCDHISKGHQYIIWEHQLLGGIYTFVMLPMVHIPVLLNQHTYNNLLLWYGVYDPVFSSLWAECCLFLNIQCFSYSWLFLRLVLSMF